MQYRFWVRVIGPVLGGLVFGIVGCGGSGGGSSIMVPKNGSAVSEATLAKSSGMRVPPGPLVVLDLEKVGSAPENDTDEVGTDRIPYRLDEDTRFTVEVKPEDDLSITLISSVTGRLVMDVGPDNPSFDADLPKGDYDLYIHSGQSGENSIPVFARSEKVDGQTRDAFGSWWKVNFGRECKGCNMAGGFYYRNNWKNVNIEGADLTDANLVGVNMEGVKAARATFTGARMEGMYVQGGDFTDAIFAKANVPDVDFSNTTFIGVRAENAVFEGTKFSGADVSGTSFKKARLVNVDFTNARLNSASFEDASLATVTLNNVKAAHLYCMDSRMQQISATGAELGGANLLYAYLNDFDFTKANLNGATFHGGTFRKGRFIGTTMTNVAATDAHFVDSTFRDVDFTSSLLVHADFTDSSLTSTRMAGVNAQRAFSSRNTRFEDVDARNINLAESQFTGTTFSRTPLTNAKARDMSAKDVTFSNLNMENADFSRMDGKNVKFTSVDAKGFKFQNARGGPIGFDYCTVYGSSFSSFSGIQFYRTEIL